VPQIWSSGPSNVRWLLEDEKVSLWEAAPNFELPFVSQTDAPNRVLGAVLSQEVDGIARPVLYLRRKLVEREERYSTLEKECLSIKWAMLCSDHAPLHWLHRMKDTNPRITRSYLALLYSFQVVHKRWKDGSIPIALTSHICKLMERMVNERLMFFLERKSIIAGYQCGFWKGRGTLDLVLCLEDEVRKAQINKETNSSVLCRKCI